MIQEKKKVYLWKIFVSLKLRIQVRHPSAVSCPSKDTGGRNRFASAVSISVED